MKLSSSIWGLLFGTIITLKCNASDIQVSVDGGDISGDSIGQLSVFRGIPYAAPPVGALRWKPPHPVRPWKGVHQATKFPNQCLQKYLFDDMRFRASGVSEDCLYLNIWTPTIDKSSALPVLVYFHGGGFVAGDGSELRYDGAAMAKQGMVVVTVNYRMGIFGLFSHPELSQESTYKGSGNYTFLDQHAALNWVVENIQQFGGDPSRVTIGGESAGSISVSALMASPMSKDLIAAAIGQSGSIIGPSFHAIEMKEAEKEGQLASLKLAEALGLDKNKKLIPQLRAISAQTLFDTAFEMGFQRFSVAVDGLFFPTSPESLYATGDIAKVPLLAGVNSEEGNYAWFFGDKPVTVENYHAILKDLYPHDFDAVLHAYPAQTEEQLKQTAQDLSSDRFISFSTWNWADKVNSANEQPIYYYIYDHIRPARKVSEGGTGKHNNRGAVHSAEIEYALGNLDANPLYLWQAEDYEVSHLLHSYFVQFIKTHNPNAPELPVWPEFSNNQLLRITQSPEAESMDKLTKRYSVLRKIQTKSLQ